MPVRGTPGRVRLEPLLRPLTGKHQECLDWFLRNSGKVVRWREIRSFRHLLAILPKGIYKPEGMPYSLSVKQTLRGSYPDSSPVHRPDGTWFWLYCQENLDAAKRDQEFTNVGLLRCHADRVPIGALRQVSGKPDVAYEVLGLALVAGWNGGVFLLEGFSADRVAHVPGMQGALEEERKRFSMDGVHESDAALSLSENDERRRVLATVVARQGQPTFRRELLRQFDGTCPLSRCDFEQALEAAHIRPYMGPESNAVFNGLLLRADLHTLFDLDLIAVSPTKERVIISPILTNSSYGRLGDTRIRLPSGPESTRRAELLEEHLMATGLG